MTIIQKLSKLGFKNATDLGSKKDGKVIVRVWTDKGWAYERFSSVEQVEAWAKGRNP
ncbi:hypothetical protein [Mesorhizobium sp.]|uniref:hypothetical protein n=1 Tax=Mesorhizobium sp. TaxID=1871066 RepID=UPI00257A61E0|nr:hypothetical protein [Mesorhizobium sp.]